MQAVTFSRIAYPLTLVAIVGAAVVVPVLRVRAHARRWPLGIVRNRGGIERAVTLMLLLLAAGFALWAVAYALLGPGPLRVWRLAPTFQWIGWCAVALGLVIVVVAQTQMGLSWRLGIDAEPTPLVTGGLYRFVRHPIYTGVMTALGGFLLISPAWALIALDHAGSRPRRSTRRSRHPACRP